MCSCGQSVACLSFPDFIDLHREVRLGVNYGCGEGERVDKSFCLTSIKREVDSCADASTRWDWR